jgi:integrase
MPPYLKNSAAVSGLENLASAGGTGTGDEEVWVSSISRWTDRRWVFDGKSVGAGTSTVTCIWDFELHDGSTLFDPQHLPLLNEARHFFFSLYSSRFEGRQLKSSASGAVFSGLRRLLKWMVEHNYAGFDELNSRALSRFCDWLVDFYAAPSTSNELDGAEADDGSEDYDDELDKLDQSGNPVDASESSGRDIEEVDPEDIGGVTPAAFGRSLSVWRHLWQQRAALGRLGIRVMPEAPFEGTSVHKVSLELATKLTSRIPALPDPVAIVLMNEAHKFIATAADDLIRAVNGLFNVRKKLPQHVRAALAGHPDVIEFFRNFQFTALSHTGLPWHETLGIRGTSPGEELRRLVDELVDACVLIAQAETGMRIGEISALLAGMNQETGLPSCITVRPSKTGMLDLYYLNSTLTKLRPLPVKEEWLLAAAPRGTEELPDAVRVIVVLQKLLAPVRELAHPEVGKYLLVTIGVPRGFPTTAAGVTEPNNYLLRMGQKDFARSFVDWDEIQLTEETRPYKETRGNCLRTHQWRKTYAQYVFQVDKRMLPAISRQFKHLSLAMTEGAYVGTSDSLVTGVAEHNRDLTSKFFLARVRGKASKLEGRLAKLIDRYLPELQKIVAGMADNEAPGAIDTWCRNRDMKIFFHGYGQCIPAVAPAKAECHKRAQTVHWANKAPNFAYREASVCTGCYLFLAGEETVDHWTKRYVDNKVIWLTADAKGRGNEFRVAKTRADQAKSYLITLGAEIPEVETANEG